ncbi:MAG TPA: aspartyl protease family protein, partial [Caulobacterales bacterium]|nr:aspartyl protease family protein [Caulobacterales bacterium]
AGEQGMLGFDGMAGRLLQIDFANRCVEVSDAEAAATRLVGWSMVQGRLRFGSMLMARGEIQGVGVNVLVDTGSDMSLCNAAFRAALASVRAEWVQYQEGRAFTAGRPLYARDSIWTPTLRLGRVRVRSVTAYQGEYHIFALWGLQDQPTLLLGMDVIRAAGGLAIDYRRNAIYFRTPPHGAS